MSTYVIAGGSRGIGLELVRMLAPSAARIDVWSRSAGELPPSVRGIHVNCCCQPPVLRRRLSECGHLSACVRQHAQAGAQAGRRYHDRDLRDAEITCNTVSNLECRLPGSVSAPQQVKRRAPQSS